MALATTLLSLGIPAEQATRLGYEDRVPLDGSGITQGAATALLSTQTNVALGTSVGDTAFRLPADAELFQPYFLLNTTTPAALIYPPVGDTIDAGAVNAATMIEADLARVFQRIEEGRWVSFASGEGGGGGEALPNVYIVPPSGNDDQVAINEAIDALVAVGGGTVRLTAGDYEIAETISLVGGLGITIEGEGYDTCLKLTADTQENVITVTNSINVVIRNLRADGNRANNAYPGDDNDERQNCIYAEHVDGLEIYGCYLESAIFHGIHATAVTGASHNISIHDNDLCDNGYRGAHIHGRDAYAVNYSKVYDNFVFGNGQEAPLPNSGLFCTFANSHGCVVSGNVIWGENGRGIEIAGSFATDPNTTIPAERSIVANNIIMGCKYAGISIGEGTSKLTVANNIVSGTQLYDGQFGFGVLIQSSGNASTLSDIAIIGNQVDDSASMGIVVTSTLTTVKGLTIQGNTVEHNVGSGIAVIAGVLQMDGVDISGNIVRGNGNCPIQILSTTPASTNARRNFRITGNQCFENKTGIQLTGLTYFTFNENSIWDNVDNDNEWGGGASTSQDGATIAACTFGTVSGNHSGPTNRTNTGAKLVLTSTSADIEVAFNEVHGAGTGISVQGTRICTRGNYGSADIKHTATSVDCISLDDHSTNVVPFTNQGGTRSQRRRLLATSTAPTSAGTAGIIGDEIFDGAGDLYRCTASGSVGAATWKKLTSATAV